MHRTSVSIAHAGGLYKPKEPFRILAGLLAPSADWADGLGESFRRNLGTEDISKLDCGCALEHGSFDFHDGGLVVLATVQIRAYLTVRTRFSVLPACGGGPS